MAGFSETEMKKTLGWESREVANIFDEVTLWSAPFGRMLLEHIPMMPRAKIVDIGFGTGFPLIELSQRFGDQAKIYGIDIWQEGINRAKDKIKILAINNIEILEEMVGEEHSAQFFEQLILKINQLIESNGAFTLSIPMLYLEFEKA